jgi:Na+/proline symporter
MKSVSWKWFLPIFQLALALACHVYEPHEYRVRARLDRAVNNLGYVSQHTPALAGRISQGINFPAMALAYPLRNEDDAIYRRNCEYTLIWIAPRDIGFFLGVLLSWYWLGRKLDESLGRSRRAVWPRAARIAGLAGGVVFGGLTGAYAIQMIISEYRPENQIGAFGIVWSFALIAYFTWRLTQEFRAAARRP